jgi:hypothetical protein
MLENALKIQVNNLDEKFKLLIDAAEKKNELRFQSQQQAVNKAESAAEKRFESVNEFRRTLSDQTATFLTRNEYGIQQQSILERFEAISSRVAALDKTVGEIREHGSGKNAVWTSLPAIIAVAISLVTLTTLFLKP